MANLSSLALAGAAVATIGIVSFILGQNQNRKIANFDDIAPTIKEKSPDFEFQELLIAQDGLHAIAIGANDEMFFVKSMGNEFAVRKITSQQIFENGENKKIMFDDLTFPDFEGKFAKFGGHK